MSVVAASGSGVGCWQFCGYGLSETGMGTGED